MKKLKKQVKHVDFAKFGLSDYTSLLRRRSEKIIKTLNRRKNKPWSLDFHPPSLLRRGLFSCLQEHHKGCPCPPSPTDWGSLSERIGFTNKATQIEPATASPPASKKALVKGSGVLDDVPCNRRTDNAGCIGKKMHESAHAPDPVRMNDILYNRPVCDAGQIQKENR